LHLHLFLWAGSQKVQQIRSVYKNLEGLTGISAGKILRCLSQFKAGGRNGEHLPLEVQKNPVISIGGKEDHTPKGSHQLRAGKAGPEGMSAH
jgi:hypothetical protein